MSQVAIFLDPKGKMGVRTPYNALFVDELKKAVPSAGWDSLQGIWFFDPISKDQAEKLLEKYYPPTSDLQLARITWNLKWQKSPSIDGVELLSIHGSSWRWKRNFPLKFKVIRADLQSHFRSGFFGVCTIEIHLRPGAVISPDPESLKILEEGDSLTLFARFTDEELARELIRPLVMTTVLITAKEQYEHCPTCQPAIQNHLPH